MPKWCCVYGCNSSSSKYPPPSFFTFPKESKLSKAWKVRIGRKHFTPTRTSYVCSRHFLPEDITSSNTDTPDIFKRHRLAKGALPSVNLRGRETEELLPKRRVRSKLSETSDERLRKRRVRSKIPKTSHALSEPQEDDDVTPITINPASTSKTHSKEEENEILLKKIRILEGRYFCYNNLTEDEVQSYTGVEKTVFETVAAVIARFFPLNYWSGEQVTSLSHKDQLLICCMKLKLDLPYFDIAQKYAASQNTVQNIFMTYLHAMHEIFFAGIIPQLPPQSKNPARVPCSLREFNNCMVIFDCIEFDIATPRNNLTVSSTFRNHKDSLSVKYLIGVASNGAITFLSQGFPGSTNDNLLTAESGIVSHLVAGDLILADKGFVIHDLLPTNRFPDLPAFLCEKIQFTKEEAVFSRKNDDCRIHVDNAIERLKDYKILQHFNESMRPFADKIVQTCAVLVNLQSPNTAGIPDV